MKYDVAVIGGGLSGLAATVDLALRGARVVLIEQSHKLGGRCYSFTDPESGDTVDNGQHILVGAYHHTLLYLELIGTRKYLNENASSSLLFFHPDKGLCDFSTRRIPPVIGVPGGILSSRLFSTRDRLKMLSVGKELQIGGGVNDPALPTMSVEEWLTGLGQSKEAQRCFWNPIAVSVMNESPERASALLFARAIKIAFLGAESDSTILIPSIGQTELYVEPALELLKNRDVELRTGTEVQSLAVCGSGVNGVVLKTGETIEADSVISSVPFYAFERLLPVELRNNEAFHYLSRFESSPIVSINIWFDQEFMAETYIGVIGRNIQWLFNRNAILNSRNGHGSHLTAIISAAYDVVEKSKDELVSMALNDIAQMYPDCLNARVLQSSVIKEKRATFSCTAAVEPLRPSAKTSIEHLYLAGDWTNTGLPGTIEGAIMSGFTAAKAVRE